jgi:hypothetical protein
MTVLEGDLQSSPGKPADGLMHIPWAADYNATLTEVKRIHEGLAIFRVVPDGQPIDFVPGQYTVLGLHELECPSSGVAAPPIRRA